MNSNTIHKLDNLDDAITPYTPRKTREIKQQALELLGHEDDADLKVAEAKRYRAKTNKIKRSSSKAQRAQNHKVERAARDLTNFN